MEGCLDENQVLCLVDSEAGESARETRSLGVAAHLDRCPDCRTLVGKARGVVRTARRDDRYPPGSSIGRFVVLETLGEGGMGVVLAARDTSLDRTVALKLVRPIADAGGDLAAARERLVREAKALARLSHPNVLTVFDVGTFEDQVFIAMELASGGTLREWLRCGRRGWREILEQFLLAGRGLQAAHRAGLVHRDFKPDNVLLLADDRIRVADFGVAGRARLADAPIDATADTGPFVKLDDLSITRSDARLGTPLYMAPEQHDSAHVGPAADQFAFCVALFEALHGEHPFQAPSAIELVIKLREGEVNRPPAASTVPRAVHDILLRGLRTDPAQRWPSMGELLDALARHAAHSATVAPPPAPLRGTVARLRQLLDQADAHAAAGRYDAGIPIARRAADEASRIDYAPIRAEAWFCLGSLQGDAGDARAAERSLADAAVEAARAKDDPLAARIWSRMLAVVGYLEGRSTDAMMLRPAAEAALARVGDDPEAQAQLLSDLGVVVAEHGRFGEALAYSERALALLEQALGPDALPVARAVNRVAYTQAKLGRHGESFRHHERALAIWRKTLPEDHPQLAFSLNNLGELYYAVGDHGEAIAHHRRALAIRERALRADHPWLALSHHNLGLVLLRVGDVAEARTHFERALAIRRAALGDDHPDVAESLHGLAGVLDAGGDHDAACAYHVQANAAIRQTVGANHFRVAASETALAEWYESRGRRTEAHSHYAEAAAICARSVDAAHPLVARARDGAARTIGARP
jgi:eukaryotic-like serine/threonine-protein kinase